MTQEIKSFQLNINEELLLNGNPSNNLGAATKQYVDSNMPQVSLLTSGTNYASTNNGIFYYSEAISIPPNSNATVILPIACNNGTKILFSSGHIEIDFVSLSTTQLIMKNNDLSLTISSNWVLIAL